jgi:invasion protein IalB
MTTRSIAWIAGIAAIACATSLAAAQTPQRTTATYGDWTLRCETQAGPPARKLCEIVQTATAQGQPGPIAQIAIGRTSKAEKMRMVFQLPINIWIPAGLHFVHDEKAAGVTAAFTRCLPIGCFADLELTDDLVKKLRAQNGRGRYEFKDGSQRVVPIPISFNGFGQAYDALLKE